jgi:hypothetical protein
VKKGFDASDEQEVQRATTKSKRERDRELADLKKLLQQDWGRRIVWRVLDYSGLHRTSFTGNSTTFFNEGQRNIGLWLVDEVLSADTDSYLLMLKENRGDNDA